MLIKSIFQNCEKAILISSIALFPMITSCDDEYDLSDINSDITVGGDIKIPIGETEELTLSRIIDLTNQLYVDESGNYALSTDGSINFDIAKIKSISVKDLATTPNVIDLKVYLEGSTIVPEYLIDSDVVTVLKMDAIQEIPEEVERVDVIDTKPVTAYIVVKLIADDMSVISKIKDACLKDFTIYFPKEVIFADGIDELDYESNAFTTKKVYNFDKNGEIRVPLDIVGLHNLPEIVNGQMHIIENLDCQGHISAKTLNVCGDDFAGFRMTVQFDVPVFEVTDVTGIVNTDINMDSETVEFGDLPDVVTDPETRININTLSLCLSLDNPIGVPFNATLNLTALDAQKREINEKVSFDVNIDKAEGFAQSKVTNLFVTNSKTLEAPAGYKKVYVENLSKIISQVPEYVKIDPVVTVDKTQTHTLRLGTDYATVVNYDMQMPFEFGEGSHIVYKESIDNLQSDIEDFSDKVTQMEVFANVESTLPFQVKLAVVPYDFSGNDMSNRIEYTPYVVIAPGSESAPTQDVEMKFSEKVKGSLADLDKIEFVVEGDTKAAVSVLKPTQYIKLKMTARIPEGITITE